MHNKSLGVSQQWHSSTSKKTWGANNEKRQNWKEITVENGRDAEHSYNGSIS